MVCGVWGGGVGCSASRRNTAGHTADEDGAPLETDYARWRELKRLVIAFGLPRDDDDDDGASADGGAPDRSADACSLRGRIWKRFLGVDAAVDGAQYAALAARGASAFDGDIRNDTFRYTEPYSVVVRENG